MQDQNFTYNMPMDHLLLLGVWLHWLCEIWQRDLPWLGSRSSLRAKKTTTEILTKNVALFAISCIMYLVLRLLRQCTVS